MSVQQFCLRWNNHQPNFISVCSSLLHNGTLVDVTLAAEGRQLQAHKIVLSACSSYFQTLFTTNPCQHPIVILKDVQYDDLKTMVDFMYYGEVNVSQEQLPHILKTAEMLKIKGLAEMPTDPANLTKSDNKSLNEGAELVGSHGQSGASTTSSATGLGSSTSGSVNDSIWGGTEAQFQQQQQQQTQQQQHQQHAQQHHHHHHHQQQQQNNSSQTQTSQGHHQLRRTPSPLGAGTSPATRRKRLRKSSNNVGSGERTNTDDHHNSLEASNSHGGISLSQMSFGTGAGTALNSNISGHSLHTNKLIKDSTNTELEQTPHDSDLEDGHGHIHIQIKPEVDISGVNQSMPLDISGATTPSEHDAPNSQSSHSGLQWTVVDSNYSRFSLPACQPNLINNSSGGSNPSASSGASGNGGSSDQRQQQEAQHGSSQQQQHHLQQLHYQQQQHQQQQQELTSSGTNFSSERVKSIISPLQSNQQQQMGTKRNRVLTRQPRVKRDSDSFPSSTNNNNQLPSDPATTLDFDPFNTGGTSSTATNYSTSHHHLLSVPQRIERHVSEPMPNTAPCSPHLLSVPHATSFLIKQHSDPLLPSQHSTAHTSTQIGNTNPFAPLHRQYSHPLTGSNSVNYIIPGGTLHHPHHISLPESIYTSSSPPPAGSSHYIVPQHATVNIKSSNEASSSSMVTSIVSAANLTTKATSPPPTCNENPSNISIKMHNSTQFTTFVNEGRRSSSPTIETANSSEPEKAGGTVSKFRNSKSTSSLTHSDGRSNISQLLSTQPSSSNSFDQLPILRIKSEELQRSVSSPQTQREIITLENPRSSHCPVIRPGPALGCNFCWNTIDGHGRILRRKTKYHCPECQTNLCIVPCFQEYHERLNNEVTATSNDTNIGSKNCVGSATTITLDGRHYAKTESI